jgi:spore coat protein CotH
VIRRIGAVIACVAVGVAVSDAQVRPSADDLFDGSTLHDVWIHINSRDWAQLRATPEADTYYPCDFEWRALEAYNAGCRSRGNYTRNGIKPGLRVEFEHYVTGQTFLGLTSLVLDNFWQDPSMLKERIVMQLFQRMGSPRRARRMRGSTSARRATMSVCTRWWRM